MPKTVKIDGVYYVVKSNDEIVVEELLAMLENKGVVKKSDVENIKKKPKIK